MKNIFFILFTTTSLISSIGPLEAVHGIKTNKSKDSEVEEKTPVSIKTQKQKIDKHKKGNLQYPESDKIISQALSQIEEEQREIEKAVISATNAFPDEMTPVILQLRSLLSTQLSKASALQKNERQIISSTLATVNYPQNLVLKHIEQYRQNFISEPDVTENHSLLSPLKVAKETLQKGEKYFQDIGENDLSKLLGRLAKSYDNFAERLRSAAPKDRGELLDSVPVKGFNWKNGYFITLSHAYKILGTDFSGMVPNKSKLVNNLGKLHFKRAFDKSSPYFHPEKSTPYPINPASEYAVYLFNRFFIGSGVTPSTTISLRDVLFQVLPETSSSYEEVDSQTAFYSSERTRTSLGSILEKNPAIQKELVKMKYGFPILVSKSVPGVILNEQIVDNTTFNLTNFTPLFLTDAFVLYQDGKGDNTLAEDGRGEGIDRELSWRYPFIHLTRYDKYQPTAKSTLFCDRPNMEKTGSKEARKRTLGINPFIGGLFFLKSLQDLNNNFLNQKNQGYFSEIEYDSLKLPFKLPPYIIRHIISGWEALQEKYKAGNPTHQEMFEAINPLLASYYKKYMEKQAPNILQAFNDLYGGSNRANLESVLPVEDPTVAPLIDKMKEEIISDENEPKTIKECALRILNEVDFGKYKKSEKIKILETALEFFPDLISQVKNASLNNISLSLLVKALKGHSSPQLIQFLVERIGNLDSVLASKKISLVKVVLDDINIHAGYLKDYLNIFAKTVQFTPKEMAGLKRKGLDTLLTFVEPKLLGLPPELLQYILLNFVDIGDVRERTRVMRINLFFKNLLKSPQVIGASLSLNLQKMEQEGNARYRFFRDHVFDKRGLDGFDLEGADLEGTKFLSCSLNGANFTKSNMNNVIIKSSLLEKAQLSTHIQNTLFSAVYANGVNLSKSVLRNVKFESIEELEEGNFNDGEMSNVTFNGVNLAKSTFHRLNANNLMISLCIIDSIDLSGATLVNFIMKKNLDLKDAVYGPKFDYGNISHSNMDKAFLGRASFVDATFKHVSMNGLIAKNSCWTRAKGDKLSLVLSVLDGSDCENLNISNLDMTKATLNEVDFLGANFSNANFSKVVGYKPLFNESTGSVIWKGARLKFPYFIKTQLDTDLITKENGIKNPAFILYELVKPDRDAYYEYMLQDDSE